jgi:hypothetical protein
MKRPNLLMLTAGGSSSRPDSGRLRAGEGTTSGITLRQLIDTYGVVPPAPITAR